MKIFVTKSDIARGYYASPCRCPVARAVRRQLRKKVAVSGDGTMMIANSDKTFTVVDLPDQVKQFIHDFDYGVGEPQPFEFEIDTEGCHEGNASHA